jgi:hypothetical protein
LYAQPEGRPLALPVLVAVVAVVEVFLEVVVVEVVIVPPRLYVFNLFDPPQYSDELPLQGMLQPVKPSGAGPPPLENTLPQSIKKVMIAHD